MLPDQVKKASLKKALAQISSEEWDIPLVIGGKEIRTGNTGKVVMPHDHHHVLATYHKAGEKEVQMAIDAAMKAHKEWSETSMGGTCVHYASRSRVAGYEISLYIERLGYVGTEQEPVPSGDRRSL